ncbi:MAG: hypothetical protein IJL66_07295 [Lachnospiraceae bacterium]|nr:hypothetical protein [Lachnospiraceae bacterium]
MRRRFLILSMLVILSLVLQTAACSSAPETEAGTLPVSTAEKETEQAPVPGSEPASTHAEEPQESSESEIADYAQTALLFSSDGPVFLFHERNYESGVDVYREVYSAGSFEELESQLRYHIRDNIAEVYDKTPDRSKAHWDDEDLRLKEMSIADLMEVYKDTDFERERIIFLRWIQSGGGSRFSVVSAKAHRSLLLVELRTDHFDPLENLRFWTVLLKLPKEEAEKLRSVVWSNPGENWEDDWPG